MTTTPTQAELFDGFLASIAASADAAEAFTALQKMAQDTVGAKIFTIMQRIPNMEASRRLFTSHPEEYPTSKIKKGIADTEWTRTVIDRQEIYVANDLATIDTVFPDAVLIDQLGCASVINVPMIVGGEVIGTMNILHEEGYYTPERVAAAKALALPALTAMLLHLTTDQTAKEAA